MIGIGADRGYRSRRALPLAESVIGLPPSPIRQIICRNVILFGRYNMGDRSYRELVLAIQQAKLETDGERTSVKPAIARADEISSARSLAGWPKPHL